LIAFATSQGLEEGTLGSRHEIKLVLVCAAGCWACQEQVLVKYLLFWCLLLWASCFAVRGSPPLGRSRRKKTSLYLHVNSPALAVAVKQITPVSAIMFGSKCHNSLTWAKCNRAWVLHTGFACSWWRARQAGKKHGCDVEYSFLWAAIPLPGQGSAVYLRTKQSSAACLWCFR